MCYSCERKKLISVLGVDLFIYNYLIVDSCDTGGCLGDPASLVAGNVVSDHPGQGNNSTMGSYTDIKHAYGRISAILALDLGRNGRVRRNHFWFARILVAACTPATDNEGCTA